MGSRQKQKKQIEIDLDKAISDLASGNDLSWARTGKTSKIQRVAVWADKAAGRDLTWARKSKLNRVRLSAAHADYQLGNDLSWTENDPCKAVKDHFVIKKVSK